MLLDDDGITHHRGGPGLRATAKGDAAEDGRRLRSRSSEDEGVVVDVEAVDDGGVVGEEFEFVEADLSGVEGDADDPGGSVGVDGSHDRSPMDPWWDPRQGHGLGVGQPPRGAGRYGVDEEPGHLADEVEFVTGQGVADQHNGVFVEPPVQTDVHGRQLEWRRRLSPEQPDRRAQVGLPPVGVERGDHGHSRAVRGELRIVDVAVRGRQQSRQRNFGRPTQAHGAETGFGEVDEEGAGRTVVRIAEAVGQVGGRGDPAWSFFGRRNGIVEPVASGFGDAGDVESPGTGVVEGEFGHAEVVVRDLVCRLQAVADEELRGGFLLRAQITGPIQAALWIRIRP